MWLKVQCCQWDYYVALCFNPPNLLYFVDVFITHLSGNMDSIISERQVQPLL
jgi:hypothetical protein